MSPWALVTSRRSNLLNKANQNMLMFHVSSTIVSADSDDDDFEQLFPSFLVPLPPLKAPLSSNQVSKPNKLPALLKNAQALLIRIDPVNTTPNNQIGMRSLTKILSRFKGNGAVPTNNSESLENAKQTLFPEMKDGDQHNSTKNDLKQEQRYLIKFVSDMCIAGGKYFKPTKIKNFILSIQQYFSNMWNKFLKLITGSVFACKFEGLMSMLDNKFRELQAKSLHTSSHNVMCTFDLEELFLIQIYLNWHQKRFQTKIILLIGILTPIRPTAFKNF